MDTMPAVMVTVAAVLGLKAVAMAESVAETVANAGHEEPAATTEAHAEETAATPATPQCAAPSLAEMAGLSQAEVQVLQALGARRQALDARGEQIETQDALMLAAKQRMTERLAELRQLETHVNDLLGQLDEVAIELRGLGLDAIAGFLTAALVTRVSQPAHGGEQRLDRSERVAFGEPPQPAMPERAALENACHQQ